MNYQQRWGTRPFGGIGSIRPWTEHSGVLRARMWRPALYDTCPSGAIPNPVAPLQSPVAGHIRRLKMLKRQMFGRARLDLLSRRFLLAPRARRARGSYPQEQSDAHAQAVAA